MVTLGLTEMVVPLPASIPPHEPVYHFQAAASFSVPVPALSTTGAFAQVGLTFTEALLIVEDKQAFLTMVNCLLKELMTFPLKVSAPLVPDAAA